MIKRGIKVEDHAAHCRTARIMIMANWRSFVKQSKQGELYERGGLFRAIHPVSIKVSKLGQLAICWNFDPANLANPTRFLPKIDQ